MFRRTFLQHFGLALGVVPSRVASAQTRGTLTIAAAADLQTVLPAIASRFEKTTGITPILTFGASGSLFAQIQNGAPFDLFLSADAEYPRRLAAAGHIDAGSVYDYATGRLVVWTRQDSGLDVNTGLALVIDPRVRRIAIANPATAPYGRAAVAALRNAGVFASVEKKLVNAENVSQAAQLAESGNAQIALIGHALAVGPSLRQSGHFLDVPEHLHRPIVQSAGVVSASRQKNAAQAFLMFLKSADGAAMLRTFGFIVPTDERSPARQ